MPAKNVIKTYVQNGCYHIYNRGVEKRTIFQDEEDYKVFLSYLKTYLSPKAEPKLTEINIANYKFKRLERALNNYFGKIDLLAYCLMPNHFHLMVKQKDQKIIEYFMRSLLTKYSGYFNKKYDRVGSLFQGPYKAILIEKEEYLLHLSRYIHLNPFKEDSEDKALADFFSSYADYIGEKQTSWINKELVLSFFKTGGPSSYKSFVEDYHKNKELPDDLMIDVKDSP